MKVLWLLAVVVGFTGCLSDASEPPDPAPVTPSEPGPPAAADAGSAPAPGSVAKISVSVRLDPRLTGGHYLGAVWVPAATFVGVRPDEAVQVPVKATAVDAQGRKLEVPLAWSSSQPGMVQVTPGSGERVLLTISDSGQAEVSVSSGEVTTKLPVRAKWNEGVLQVEVGQR